MLGLMSRQTSDCERVSRRSMLQLGVVGGLGISLPGALKLQSLKAEGATRAYERNCIFIWTHGGTSHHDTLDPKPLASDGVRGPFGVIDTAVPGVQFTEVCPRLAKELNRFSVLRSWNPKNAGHGVADQWCMSGRQPNPSLTYPCVGSVVSHQRGFRTALPPFVQLGNSMDHTFGGGVPGVLGIAHSPFEIDTDPNQAKFNVRDITPPMNMDGNRIDRRKSILAQIDQIQRRADLQPRDFEALDEHYRAALNMVTAPETKKAFDIESEDAKLRDDYGRNPFGQRLLLARRLIESGVRYVTVADPSWDTHADNFNALKNSRMPPIDQGLPQLLIDLERLGMLENTLVVWMTDFGRTPKINSASGRDHWATAGFVVMAGAGIPGGAVIGETDDIGSVPIRDEYLTEHVVATIYEKLGIPLDLSVQADDGRPVRLLEGEPVRQWT